MASLSSLQPMHCITGSPAVYIECSHSSFDHPFYLLASPALLVLPAFSTLGTTPNDPFNAFLSTGIRKGIEIQ